MILQQPFGISPSSGVSGFLYYSPISINSAQVPSTQTNFPVLVSQTDNRFKTVGNGGHVQNSSGFDIRPYSDTGISSALTYWIERYNATTGEVIMWVKVASLSSSTTPIYLAYGNSTLTTDGSDGANTWSNGFRYVYPLADGTTLSVADARGVNNGTNHSATAATGQIDGAAAFVAASSQYIALGTQAGTASLTYSAWIKGTSFPNAANVIIGKDNTGGNNAFAFLKVTSGSKLGVNTNQNSATGTTTLSTGTWYYVAIVYDSTLTTASLKGYLNASVECSANTGSPISLPTNSSEMNIGQLGAVNPGLFWNGSIDHATLSSSARSGDWITTEYNNQNAPGTFETLGTEVPL